MSAEVAKEIPLPELQKHREQVMDGHPDLIRFDTARQIEAALRLESEPTREDLMEVSKKAVETLRLLSPWIALLTAKLDPEKEYQKIDLEIFKPSIKDLNDTYLGYQGTNDYVAEIREIIQDIFTVDGVAPHVLGLPFKGASILALNGMTPEVIEHKVKEIKTKATGLLIEKALAHAKTKAGNADKTNDQFKTELGFDQSFFVDIEFGIKPWGKIDQDGLISTEESAKRFAVNMEDSVRAVYEAIRRAHFDRRWYDGDVASNVRRGARRNNDPSIHDMHRPRLADRASTYDLLKKEYESFFNTVALNNEGEMSVKEGWEGFVEIIENQLILNPKYVHLYRKGVLKQYLEGISQGDKYHVIDRYMRALKILDTLHPYTDKNFSIFLEKIKRIIDLIKSAENLDSMSDDNLKEFLAKASAELKVSLKDEGEGVFATEYAMIGYLMKENGQIRLDIGDIQGFGDASLLLLSTQVAQIAALYNPENPSSIEQCEQVLLQANDIGTKHLNELKRKAQTNFPPEGSLSVYDLGDEMIQITRAEGGPRDNIEKIARESRMRIVSILLENFRIESKEDVRTLIAIFKWVETQIVELKLAETSYTGAEGDRPLSLKTAKYSRST